MEVINQTHFFQEDSKMKKKIVSLAALAALAGAASVQAGTIEFTGVATPVTDAEKRAIMASPSAVVDNKTVKIGYKTILRSGDKGLYSRSSEVFGQLVDQNGAKLYAEDGSARISNSNDFSSLLIGEDSKLYMVSQFEDRPGAMYLTQLNQGRKGDLTPLRTRVLDASSIHGGWVHCAGSVTPWGTHLASEEYEPDAQDRDPATGSINNDGNYYNAMAAYVGGNLLSLNPYHYGFPIEVKVNSYDNSVVTKHYAMGRAAIELAYVMPDQKTAYISDDGTNVGLFRFVADTEGQLSSGTLYAAKFNQTSGVGLGEGTLTWVNLGHATNAQVEGYLGFKNDGSIKTSFLDIFEQGTTDGAGGCTDASFTAINTTRGYECLKVKPGMEIAASRLETRRYAAMVGATTEWRKMEGITFNSDTNKLYLAMSEVAYGMEDYKKKGVVSSSYDKGGPNDIRLEGFNSCGGVYTLDLDSNYAATNMVGLVAGIPMTTSYGRPGSDDPAYDGKNKCNLDGLANPDNISYIPGYNTLIIGEDTGSGHQNDLIWSAKTSETCELTRIQTTPYGSETTSPYVYPNINGYGYIMSVIQHPYGESDSDKLVTGSGQDRAYTGFIGPFPALDK